MIEQLIFSNLVLNEDFGRKTLPFLKVEYFSDMSEHIVFKLISSFVNKYNKFPSVESLQVDLASLDGLTEGQFDGCVKIIENIKLDAKTDHEWLLNQTEAFCKKKALYNAIMGAIKLMDDTSGKTTQDAIPQMLQDALAVSFDSNIGHDYIESAFHRWEYYHLKEHKIPFNLDMFNKITMGGVSKKTLNIIMAGTGVGKSMLMGFMAASHLMMGENVLYISGEMAEERLAERIDAHLLDTPMKAIRTLTKEIFETKIAKVKSKTTGKLIIKEYPTGSANVNHIRHLLNELKIKKNFVPTIIYIDYLNIFASSRLRRGNVNSYEYIKSIAEEFRGLAVEFNLPIISATQVNREGFKSSDFGLENTSESFGLPATADLMVGLISTDQLKERGQIMVKQLKNRYNDENYYNKFVIGLDKSKMRFYDCEQEAQDEIIEDDVPVMDNTRTGDRMTAEKKGGFKNKMFEDFS